MKQIKRGEIYYADISPTIGSEQGGNRPVLILQNDVGNRYSPTTIVAPITSKKVYRNFPTHVQIQADGLYFRSVVLLEQIRTIDKCRLGSYVGKLEPQTMAQVDHTILTSLGLHGEVEENTGISICL